MTEQHKESSTADSKEKKTSQGDEIGKEFLSSWKSMSMEDDDAIDFGFDTVSKGKKKPFDFEKMDLNFNLDGEFGKISSFKLDMSDLDFTCPPKKNSQSKDKKGEVSGAKRGKQDEFNFNFDFNELDSFNLDSSFMQVDTTSNSNPRKKVVNNEGSDEECAKRPKSNTDEGVRASNDSTAVKSHAPEGVETFKVETKVGNLGNLVSKQDGSVSNISSSGNLDMQERDLPEKENLTESISEQVIDMPCSEAVGQSDSEQHTISDQHTEVISSGTRESGVSGDKQEITHRTTYQCTEMFSSGTREINVSGDTQEINDKATNMKPDTVDLQLEPSSSHHITKSDNSVGEAITLGRNAQGVTNDPEPENRYTSYENINKSDALKEISCHNDNKETTSVCHLAPANSKCVVEKMVLIKDNKLHDMQSSMFSTPEGNRSLKQSSTVGTKGISLGNKKNTEMVLGSITQKRENLRPKDTKFGSKMAADSLTDSSKLMKDAAALLGNKDDLRSSSDTREGIVSDVTPCSGTLAGNKQSFCEEVNNSKITVLERAMPNKDVNMLSSQVNLSCLTDKPAIITNQVVSVNSQPEASGKESSQKSRITSVEGNKLTLKNFKVTPALSSLKTSRILTTSLHQKETNSIVSSGQSIQIQGITRSKNDNPIDINNNKKPSTPFLKRKTIEVSEADFTSLRSLKRISQSLSKSRDSKELSEEVIGEVESMPNNLLYKQSNSGLKSPPEIKVMEVEIPDSSKHMEDNSNVEKAEAYMKELEDICSMLKKKHEEAKDLLVRAIVNDNNLLMLNHPIYEEEIRKVQKFASQLMSKGIQT
ncbi:hypothetical protein PHAVU_003G057800 [Phaseolus vulgaris]|uniref:Uncharacterized protein n=1 Tax=Phaseolus vulgaris TaxID=3885 RepID=V7C8M9_PHAVU|nr:hypothetical protein PHAVU_003G057800g [Phaseolus vulgaris]ESW25698.1 hypothetical protein PHAVU_003G057800g [Phaseolus vulgaris]